MSENTVPAGGSTGDAVARQAAGAGTCCGGPAQGVDATRPPAVGTGGGDPCCGTRQAAEAAGSCCDAHARADAVAAGQGCCA